MGDVSPCLSRHSISIAIYLQPILVVDPPVLRPHVPPLTYQDKLSFLRNRVVLQPVRLHLDGAQSPVAAAKYV
jgi:hypothetical protein